MYYDEYSIKDTEMKLHEQMIKWTCMTLHLQGGFGAVHKAIWHGIIVAAKIIQVQKGVTVKEADIMRYSFCIYLKQVM